MHKIGLLGGISCEGTALYYERINVSVRARLGGLSSGDILMRSENFGPLISYWRAGIYELIATTLADSAEWLLSGGAEIVLICADPMHMVAEAVAARIKRIRPRARIIHAIDETSLALQTHGCVRPLVLAMQNSLEQDAYAERMLCDGIMVRFPDSADCESVRRIILNELCSGQVRSKSRRLLLDIIDRSVSAGADSIIFACPEISFLLDPSDLLCPSFDSAAIHAEAAVACAFAESGPVHSMGRSRE